MLKNFLPKTLAALVISALAATTATASSITYVVNNNTPYQTPAVSSWDTTGADMTGMDVWVNFSDGSVQHTAWAANGTDSGGASVAGYFSITESGTTYNVDAWKIQNLSTTLAISGFTLFGAPGDTTFDRTFGGSVGTTDSALGRDFNIQGNYSVTATYSNILNLIGSPAVGDEFVQLSVAFATNTLLSAHSTTIFSQDTDNAKTHGSITPVPEVASTAMLLTVGLGAVAVLRRRSPSVS